MALSSYVEENEMAISTKKQIFNKTGRCTRRGYLMNNGIITITTLLQMPRIHLYTVWRTIQGRRQDFQGGGAEDQKGT